MQDSPVSPRPLLTYSEVAERLNVSTRHVRTFVAEGRLRPIHLSSRCVRFDPDDLDAFLRRRKARRL